jgi:cytochrome P450
MQTENMNLKMNSTSTPTDMPGFPVGFYQLHPDTSLNWQMNRNYNWAIDASMLEEMRSVSPRIHTYADYTREFMALAEQALAFRPQAGALAHRSALYARGSGAEPYPGWQHWACCARDHRLAREPAGQRQAGLIGALIYDQGRRRGCRSGRGISNAGCVFHYDQSTRPALTADYASREHEHRRYADGTYEVSTYREIVALLHDPRIPSLDADHPHRAGERAASGKLTPQERESTPHFDFFDPSEHDRLHRLLMHQYTQQRIEAMRLQALGPVNSLLDAQRGRGQLDIVDDLAYPLKVTMICRLLGVPREDEPRFHAWMAALAPSLDPAQGMNEGELLLVAGHETTVNLITNGMLTLLRHPNVLERLRRDEGVVINTVEEVLRYEPPVQFRPRTTLTDVEVAGVSIPKGATVVLLLASGSRDPARFPEPERFVPDRADNEHLGFGSGIHSCIGAPLARVEAQVALSTLARRLVNPHLVSDPPPYREDPSLRGPEHLLVAFDRLLD